MAEADLLTVMRCSPVSWFLGTSNQVDRLDGGRFMYASGDVGWVAYIVLRTKLKPSLDKTFSLRRPNATINATGPIENEDFCGDNDGAMKQAQRSAGARAQKPTPQSTQFYHRETWGNPT